MKDRMVVLEGLEARRLLAAVYPSAVEQYLVELINRARANPAAEAARFGVNLNEGLVPGTITATPKQPLAINPYITDAARKHSQYMILNDVFSHTGQGGSNGGDRMLAAGYTNISGWGENIAWSGTTGSPPDPRTTVPQLHEDLFVDEGIPGRGHRLNILDPDWKEIGAGVVSGQFTDFSGGVQRTYNAVMLTTDFAVSDNTVFLTGVAYSDLLTDDDFYTPGEGLAGITVTATRVGDGAVFTTTTWESGGYTLPLPPGTYEVRATGTGLGGVVIWKDVVISTENVKRDFRPELAADLTPPKGVANAPDHKLAGGTTYTFTVTWSDNVGIDVSSLDSNDLLVTGPNGYSSLAQFVSVNQGANGTPRTATYRISAPGGKWNVNDNGRYTISVRAGEVLDTNGNAVAAGTLASFNVQIALDTQQMKSGGDFDGDGKEDILWRDYGTGESQLWLMDGATIKSVINLPVTANTAWRIVGAGDFNSDGHDDILWYNQSTGGLAFWAMHGTTVGVYTQLPTVKYLDWTVAGTGDFNADGHADIVWRNEKTQGTLVWLMNGKGGAHSTMLPTVRHPDWVLAGVGDMTGDGRGDLIWRNTRTGGNLIWQMHGTAIRGVITLSQVKDTNWFLSGIGDLDGNGTPELLWRHLVTGKNLVWLMNGTVATGTAPLAAAFT